MGFFTADQIEALSGKAPIVGTLVDLELSTGTESLWNGNRNIRLGGRTYKGLAHLGAIEGLEESRGTESQQFQLILSGIPADILAIAISESDAVQGRIAVVSIQIFDEWQPVGSPIPLRFGIMQKPRVTYSPPNSENEGPVCTVMVPVENLMYGRSRPANGRYTDMEQQRRFPGDRFFERTWVYVNKTIVWPK